MGNFIRKAESIWVFLTNGIWTYTNEDVRGVYRWLMNVFKAVYLSIRFFLAHRIMQRASALTYYTLLAVVPIVALLLGIGRGFGLQEVLRSAIDQNFTGQKVVLNYIFEFAESYLAQTQTGLIMGIGVVFLLYVIYSLIGNIENVFNDIWQQKTGRTAVRRITDYLSITILVPIFLAISSGVQIYLQTYLTSDFFDHEIGATLLTLLRLAPFALTVLMMTFVYIIIPNCKVHFLNAFAAALIAGAVFMLFQWLYISGQIWVSKYNAIYGSFAALPLLLLWVQMSWIIWLYGAELSYASQNIQNYNFENLWESLSRHDHDFLLVLVAGYVYRSFSQQKPAPTTEEIGQALRLPARLTGELVRRLSELDVIREGVATNQHAPNNWLPGRESDKFSIASLYDTLSVNGENHLKINYADQFKNEWQTLQSMHNAALTQGQDLLLRDISYDDFKPSITLLVKKSTENQKRQTKKRK